MMTTTMTTTTIGTTKPIQLRHELKHQISPQEDLVLTGRLRRLFPHDAHAGPEGSYQVTSLYFDTPYDAALREKLDGVNRREKFRLRYYGAAPSFLKLEKKFKLNGLLRQAQRPSLPRGGPAAAGRGSELPASAGGPSPLRAVQQAAGQLSLPPHRGVL